MRITELFDELDGYRECLPIDALTALLRRLDVSRDEIAEHVSFDPEHYKRNVMHLGPVYAALILCWRPGQSSPIHDHRGSACGVRVIEGEAKEIRYKRGSDGMLIPSATDHYGTGHVCGSYDADIHTLINEPANGCDLVTLHVYTPPMEDYRLYSLDSPEVRVQSDQEVLAARARLARVG